MFTFVYCVDGPDAASALGVGVEARAWTVRRVPRATGSWVDVSPNSAISEQLARTR